VSKGPHSKLRRAARLAAVQALYQMDVGGTLSTSVVKEFIEHRFGMRAAGYEIQRRPDVPALVIIDQYVSIAADFFEGKEPGFVNGALDKMAKAVRAAEFGLVGGAATQNG